MRFPAFYHRFLSVTSSVSKDPSPFRPEARVTEALDAHVPALVHPGWRSEFPWLVQGTTTRGDVDRPFDLGLFASGSSRDVVETHWRRLLDVTGARCAVHAKQVHGSRVELHRDVAPGLTLAGACDGHATGEAGVLLSVATADCVPVFVVASEVRAVAMLHAGWRGVAAGILERGLETMAKAFDARADELHVHFGPSICGHCYEVGPEVFEALSQAVPGSPRPIDLRGVLAQRTVAQGVPSGQITVSTHCTRCTGSDLFSHRRGDGGRQVGFLGMRG